MTKCTFRDNSALRGGAVDYLITENIDMAITNCLFIGNSASKGGAVYLYTNGWYTNKGNMTIANNIFLGNIASDDGGGAYFYNPRNYGDMTMTNCTFSGNSAGDHCGGVWCSGYNTDGLMTITNCILWGNTPTEMHLYQTVPLLTYTNIQGGWEGEGNIDVDPLFADTNSLYPEEWDLHLLTGSLCIDAGTNTPDGGLPDTDLDGNERVVDGDGDGSAIVDMGAYEYQL